MYLITTLFSPLSQRYFNFFSKLEKCSSCCTIDESRIQFNFGDQCNGF